MKTIRANLTLRKKPLSLQRKNIISLARAMKEILIFIIGILCFQLKAKAGDVHYLTMQEGLANNYTTAITQDGKGRIWIGTEAGLSMFDGFHFHNFYKYKDGLADDGIICLYSQDKWLWVGTKSGLSRINLNTLIVDTLHIPALDNVVAICPGEKGTLWFANHYKCIVKYNLEDDSHTVYTAKDIQGLHMDFRSMTYSGHGIFYLGQSDGGVSIVDMNRKRRIANYLGKSSVYKIFIDKDRKAWIASNEGLYIYDEKTHTMSMGPTRNRVYSVCRFNNGEIKYTKENSRAILQDFAGNVWECEYGNGVRFTSRIESPFRVIPYNEQLADTFKPHQVFGLLAEGKSVWMGTKGEIVRKELQGNALYSLNTNGLQVQSILRLDGSHLLIGCTDGGLLMLNEPTKVLTRIEGLSAQSDINNIYRDRKGTIWLSTDVGLYTYSGGKAMADRTYAKKLSKTPAYCVSADKKGRLWIATYGKGINLMDKGAITQVNTPDDNSLKNCEHIITDRNGGIWIAAVGGLVHVPDPDDPKQYKILTQEDGLANDYLHALAEDDTGNIWMSTNQGISCWNVKNNCFENYDNHLNVPNTNFNENSIAKMDDGTIIFGSLLGACYFNTKTRGIQQAIEKVQILSSQILNDDKHSISIEFGIPDYALNGFVEYQYRIDGMNDEWISTGDNNELQFMGMAPGTYTFHVRARIKNGQWSNRQVASLTFHVPHPWYQSWWAIFIYIILVLGGLAIWFRLYRRRVYTLGLLEIDRQRFAVYEGITNELRQQTEHFRSEVARLVEERSAAEHNNTAVQKEEPSDENTLSALDQQFMDKLDALIHDNLNEEKIDIAFLTDKMAMSTSTFYRKMKAVTGISANEYVRNKRLEASCRFLLSGRYTISEVASMTGFSSQHYFRETFKAKYGMTPSEYIEKNGKP